MTALPRIAIVDYGAGNVASVAKAFRHLRAAPVLTSDAAIAAGADAIVIPGVGHFERTAAIDVEMRRAILEAIDRRKPVLGICLGLHWLFEGSDEASSIRGLGVFRGRCEPLRPVNAIKVPHVGWNLLGRSTRPSQLLSALPGSYAYFCHSYAAPVCDCTTAVTSHGRPFTSVVESERVFGVQCHPEKSGDVGLRLLDNFVRLCEGA